MKSVCQVIENTREVNDHKSMTNVKNVKHKAFFELVEDLLKFAEKYLTSIHPN